MWLVAGALEETRDGKAKRLRQIKHKMEKASEKVFSSNYTLYADISARFNLILQPLRTGN